MIVILSNPDTGACRKVHAQMDRMSDRFRFYIEGEDVNRAAAQLNLPADELVVQTGRMHQYGAVYEYIPSDPAGARR